MIKDLTLSDREYIERALKKKVPVKEIAAFLERSLSCIYREIKKGQVEQLDSATLEKKKVYLSDYAHKLYRDNKHKSGMKSTYNPEDPDIQKVMDLIRYEKYSPEAALMKTGCKMVCVKTIYNWIRQKQVEGLTLQDLPYIREKKKKKKKTLKRIQKPKEKLIESRPAEASDREVYGHWEMDTVYSSKDDKSALLVLTERKTRQELMIQTKDRTMKSILSGLNRLERKLGARCFREHFKTITCDNGVEFSDWESMEKSHINKTMKRTEIYYAHPYSSYERGSNENVNKMIRRHIPKGDDIGLYDKKEIQDIENWINNYPRKIFNGLSANAYLISIGIQPIRSMII